MHWRRCLVCKNIKAAPPFASLEEFTCLDCAPNQGWAASFFARCSRFLTKKSKKFEERPKKKLLDKENIKNLVDP